MQSLQIIYSVIIYYLLCWYKIIRYYTHLICVTCISPGVFMKWILTIYFISGVFF